MMKEKTNTVLHSPEWHEAKKKETYWIFLGGPCQGAPEWQEEVEETFPQLGITICDPRRDSIGDGPQYYEEQLFWETEHLNAADLIMFWFPLESTHVEGRGYGQTTRAELGEWLEKARTSWKPVYIGIDPGIPGARYFREKAGEYGIQTYNSLEDLMKVVIKKVESELLYSKTWYTSDTHFGSQRTLELSRRPFVNTLDMDRCMIRNWNACVRPQDYVEHLGDFGDPGVLRYLNGHIRLIPGNYEDIDTINLRTLHDRGVEILPKKLYGSTGKYHFGMSHKPSDSRSISSDYHLFGHIHGRQVVKEWKGLDVGQDAHHYRPLSEEEVNFWFEAIDKYYDQENFE